MEENSEKSSFGDIIWTICFALMYPVIAAFGLLFTGIIAVFSFISRILFLIFSKKAKK